MIDVKVERRVEYEDDLVIVKNKDGKVDYKGLNDYNPYKDEPWKYDPKNDIYTLPGGYTMKCLESKQVDEAYDRKDKYVLQDIITLARCDGNIEDCDLKSINPSYLARIVDSRNFGEDPKLTAIKMLVTDYDYFRKYDDEREDKYEKASVVHDQVIDIVKKNGFDYKDEERFVKFNSDMDLDEVLDLFEASMNIKTYGTMRGGSWTSINYKTDNGTEIQIGRSSDKDFNYKVVIYGLEHN